MVKSEYFPETLDEKLLCEPRECDNLLLPEDIQNINNNEDISLNNRPDNTINKKKQEYWSWFKIVKDTEVIQPDEPFQSFKFNTEEERKKLVDKVYKSVSLVIRESTPANSGVLNSFSSERIEKKLDVLYNNVELLKRAADEQLIENNDQKELHVILKSLFELITVYEDHLAKRQQDNLIMKSVGYTDDTDSEEEVDASPVQSKDIIKNIDNQRVDITNSSTLNSPTSASLPKTPKTPVTRVGFQQ